MGKKDKQAHYLQSAIQALLLQVTLSGYYPAGETAGVITKDGTEDCYPLSVSVKCVYIIMFSPNEEQIGKT